MEIIRKNPIKSIVIGLGLLYAGHFLYKQIKKLIDGFDFAFKSFRIAEATLTKINFEFTFDFINNSKISVPVKNLRGTFEIFNNNNWVQSGNITYPINFNFTPGTTQVKIPFSTGVFDIPWGQLTQLKEGKPIKYRFNYQLDVMGKNISDNFTDSFAVPSYVITILQSLNILKGLERSEPITLSLPITQLTQTQWN